MWLERFVIAVTSLSRDFLPRRGMPTRPVGFRDLPRQHGLFHVVVPVHPFLPMISTLKCAPSCPRRRDDHAATESQCSG
jgi:hypothetical protein